MSVPQFGHHVYWIEPSVFRKGEWHDLKSISKSFDAVLLSSFEGSGILSQLLSKFDLNGTAAWNDSSIFHQASDHTQSVVKGSLGLVDDLEK